MWSRILKPGAFLTVFLLLAGCASVTIGIHKIRLLPAQDRLSVLALLPDQLFVVVDHGFASPDPTRLVPLAGWRLNAYTRQSADTLLAESGRFQLVRSNPPSVRRWRAIHADPQGLFLSKKRLSTATLAVHDMGTPLVLVLTPSYLFAKGLETQGQIASLFGAPIALIASPVKLEGMGFGVIQDKIAAERLATNAVSMQAWLLNGTDGQMIAKTACSARHNALDYAKDTLPIVKRLWIHRKGSIPTVGQTDREHNFRVLIHKAVQRCLHNLQLITHPVSH
ncbi:MAG: hypothetical protein ACYCS1_10070 [Gammaproteobacteria bacterium]